MKKIKEDILEISNIISESFKVNKIILFGSYAKGTEKSERHYLIIFQSLLGLLIYRTDEFYERADKLKSIEREIQKEGVTIYG